MFKKRAIILTLKINVLHKFSGYKSRIFHSKSTILTVLCLVLTNISFSTFFLCGLRVDYSVKIENYFHIFLVVISMSLTIKPLNKGMYLLYQNM